MPQINGLTPARAPMAPRPAVRPLIGVARSSVRFGQVFRRYDDNGNLGDKLYGSIGNNGRFYGVNLKNGEISAADDGTARVKVVGSFELSVKTMPKPQVYESTRGALATTAVFRVKGGSKLMANLGKLNDGRFVSLNPQSQDYVISKGGVVGNTTATQRAKWSAKKVEVVGSYAIDVTMNPGERA